MYSNYSTQELYHLLTNFRASSYRLLSGKSFVRLWVTFLASLSSLTSRAADNKHVYHHVYASCRTSEVNTVRGLFSQSWCSLWDWELTGIAWSWTWQRSVPPLAPGVFLLHSASCQVLISFHNAPWQTHTLHTRTRTHSQKAVPAHPCSPDAP